MTGTQSRLERRIQRDFPKPGSADGVLRLLADLPRRAGYDGEMFASERAQAAIVLLAAGDLGRLRQMLDLAASDWRDLLVAVGLADEDWPEQLDSELGEHPQMSTRTFDTLGFSPTYSCQSDPELPGDGDWGCPVHGFRRDGGLTSGQFRSRWGTARIARFTLADATTWVGLFEAGWPGWPASPPTSSCPKWDQRRRQDTPPVPTRARACGCTKRLRRFRPVAVRLPSSSRGSTGPRCKFGFG